MDVDSPGVQPAAQLAAQLATERAAQLAAQLAATVLHPPSCRATRSSRSEFLSKEGHHQHRARYSPLDSHDYHIGELHPGARKRRFRCIAR